MCIAAGVSIGSASLATSGAITSILVFTVIASSTVAIPVIGYLVAADRLRKPLANLKVWLEDNNTTVMSVLILVVGVVLIGKGNWRNLLIPALSRGVNARFPDDRSIRRA